jgi:hypothetical protein
MLVRCEVIPRPDLTPAQYKALGRALAGARAAGILPSTVDPEVQDLLAGGPPLPLPVQLMAAGIRGPGGGPLTLRSLRREGFRRSELTRRWVVFGLSDEAGERAAAVDWLRRHVPARLVADVRVGGRSLQLTG